MIKNYISENIKFLYRQTTYSQDEFGNIFDIGKGLVSNYINGRALPKIETIQKICTHYDISLDDFVNSDLASGKNKDLAIKDLSTDFAFQAPVGYVLISEKHLRLLESTIEDKNKIIKGLELRLGEDDKSDTA